MYLRISQIQDQVALKKLISAIYADFETAESGALFSWTDDKIQSLFAIYKFVVLENKVHGLLGFICFQELSGDFEIIVLGVEPGQQGRGYMRRLLDYFVENICSRGSKIFLEVHEKNQRAISFYEKAGFKVDGLRKNYYSDGGTAVNMSFTQGRP